MKKVSFKPPAFVPPSVSNVKPSCENTVKLKKHATEEKLQKVASCKTENEDKPKDIKTNKDGGVSCHKKNSVGDKSKKVEKKALPVRSLTDSEYDAIFSAAIERSFDYDQLSSCANVTNEGLPVFPESSSTSDLVTEESCHEDKDNIQAKNVKADKNKNVKSPEKETKSCDTIDVDVPKEVNASVKNGNPRTLSVERQQNVLEGSESMEENYSEDITSNSETDSSAVDTDSTVVSNKKLKKKKSKMSRDEKMKKLLQMVRPWGSHASKSHTQHSDDSSTLIDTSFENSEVIGCDEDVVVTNDIFKEFTVQEKSGVVKKIKSPDTSKPLKAIGNVKKSPPNKSKSIEKKVIPSFKVLQKSITVDKKVKTKDASNKIVSDKEMIKQKEFSSDIFEKTSPNKSGKGTNNKSPSSRKPFKTTENIIKSPSIKLKPVENKRSPVNKSQGKITTVRKTVPSNDGANKENVKTASMKLGLTTTDNSKKKLLGKIFNEKNVSKPAKKLEDRVNKISKKKSVDEASSKNRNETNEVEAASSTSVETTSVYSGRKRPWSVVKKRFYKLEPVKFRNHKEYMMWLIKERDVGTWILCCNPACNTWRYVHDLKDPSDVPANWFCYMNEDLNANKCTEGLDEEIPDFDPEDDFDILYNEFTAGSIVWARVVGFPWWPAMVDDDVDTEAFYWLDDENSKYPSYYNVTFFDDKVTRAWVSTENIQKYDRQFRYNSDFKTKIGGVEYRGRIERAMLDAEKALGMTYNDRLKHYSFVIRYNGPIRRPAEVDDNDEIVVKPKKSNNKSGGKRKQVSTDNSALHQKKKIHKEEINVVDNVDNSSIVNGLPENDTKERSVVEDGIADHLDDSTIQHNTLENRSEEYVVTNDIIGENEKEETSIVGNVDNEKAETLIIDNVDAPAENDLITEIKVNNDAVSEGSDTNFENASVVENNTTDNVNNEVDENDVVCDMNQSAVGEGSIDEEFENQLILSLNAVENQLNESFSSVNNEDNLFKEDSSTFLRSESDALVPQSNVLPSLTSSPLELSEE